MGTARHKSLLDVFVTMLAWSIFYEITKIVISFLRYYEFRNLSNIFITLFKFFFVNKNMSSFIERVEKKLKEKK